MPTRRSLLTHALYGTAATLTAPLCRLAAQQAVRPSGTADEMTINTAPREERFPPPDFGPAPGVLPPEAEAVRGAGSLLAYARKRRLLTGAAIAVRAFEKDPALQQLVSEQFGILVPEGELKWRGLRPARDQFDFTAADALFPFAGKHHIQVRGHTLVWHNSVPDWLRKVPADSVRTLLIEHIEIVMGRYRGRVHSWDVVNEAILPKDARPGSLRKSFWFDTVGPGYIDLAFRTARKADPHAKLCYNDYGVETESAEDTERRAAILALLRAMKARGVPLDAVGIQGHIHANTRDAIGKGLRKYLAAIRAMGLDVYLTEVDVNEDDVPSDDVPARDAAVATAYKKLLTVALADPAVKLLLTWDVSDRRTWLNDGPTHRRKQPNRPQRSLPFDPEYRPTPAFFALRDCLDAAPKRTVHA